MESGNQSLKAIIHQSELDFISKCTLDYMDIETGGDLFGFWTKEGYPVVQYVIGPGPGTTRTAVSFYQDIDYLKKCGRFLNGNYGLEHIGGWHSHHRLAIAQPSAGDINTMRNALRDDNLPRFLISISNIDKRSHVSINAFLFSKNNSSDYTICNWKILDGVSPLREAILRSKTDLFLSPKNNDNAFQSEIPEETKSIEEGKNSEKAELPNDSYWSTSDGKKYLKDTYKKLEERKDLSEVELLQLEDQRIAISFKYNKGIYEIRFPNDFPQSAPEVIEKMPVDGDGIIPVSIKRMFQPNKKRAILIHDFIHSLNIIDKDTIIVIKYS